jgi:hypothetical protein
VLTVADITVGHSCDCVLLAAEDDLGGESFTFAVSQASIYCHPLAYRGFAVDLDFKATGHFLP